MPGLIQNRPPAVPKALDPIDNFHGDREIVGAAPNVTLERTDRNVVATRSKRPCRALAAHGDRDLKAQARHSQMGRTAAADRGPESAAKEDILAFPSGKIAKWWMPDDVVFVDSVPYSATGRIRKTALRARFAGYSQPT